MTQPDFIIIPTQLLSDDKLQPSDRILFGYIYWMTKLALMKCVASNATLSELTGLSERTVRVGLERLEQQGYVDRKYSDIKSHHRVEILCKLTFGVQTPPTSIDLGTNVPGGRHKRAGDLGTNVPHNKSIKNKNIKKEIVTNVTKELVAPVAYGKPELNELFEYWETKTGVGIQARRQQNRNAANNLLRRYGAEKLHQLIDGVALAQGREFAPQISDFSELQDKLTKLLVWGKSQMNKSGKVVKI